MAVIFGGGTVGEMAARVCSSLGAKVVIVEKKDIRRKYLHEINLPKSSIMATAESDVIRGAHVVIGATYDMEKADRIIDEKTLREASEVRKKIVIDVSVDQGGNFPYVDSNGNYSPSSHGHHIEPRTARLLWQCLCQSPQHPIDCAKVCFYSTVEHSYRLCKGIGKQHPKRATSKRCQHKERQDTGRGNPEGS